MIGIYAGPRRVFEPEGRQSRVSGGLSACGFVQQACQALPFQPSNLRQTVNILMLIRVSGSAGRCHGERGCQQGNYLHSQGDGGSLSGSV